MFYGLFSSRFRFSLCRKRMQREHCCLFRAVLVAGLCLVNMGVRGDPGPLTLWYTTPGVPGNATSWQHEALPVGNGKLAAMVYGGVGSEQIQFNEDTVWGGQPSSYV